MVFHEKRGVRMIIAFTGHSSISDKDNVKKTVKQLLLKIIPENGGVTFYLGGYGDFDEICASVCRELKAKYRDLETVFVTPYLKKIETNYKLGLYDSSIYPPLESVPPKYAISKRNEWMVENSDIIIAFVKRRGGAYKTLLYAKRKGKNIINLCEEP